MKRMKRAIVVLAAVLLLVSGAVTAYAVSADTDRAKPAVPAGESVQAAPADYAAEEMAVEAYYRDRELSEDAEMV